MSIIKRLYKISLYLILLNTMGYSITCSKFAPIIMESNIIMVPFCPSKTVTLPGTISLSVSNIDEDTNVAKVHIISNVISAKYVFYDNYRISLLSGTAKNGYISVKSGKHIIKVCEDITGNRCGKATSILISTSVDKLVYKKFELEEKSNGLTTKNGEIIYGGRSGNIYSLNVFSGESTYLYDTNTYISGLTYIENDNYYMSYARGGSIYKVNTETETVSKIISLPFPDGLDYFHSKLYSVTNDRSSVLSVYDKFGKFIKTLKTSIPDIVGIAHTNSYLYILSENGNIFQVNSITGYSSQIFSNENLFTTGNNYYGLEGITILNYKIYVSYIDDSSIYKINLDLRNFE